MKRALYKSFSKLTLFIVLLAGAGLVSELEDKQEPDVLAQNDDQLAQSNDQATAPRTKAAANGATKALASLPAASLTPLSATDLNKF